MCAELTVKNLTHGSFSFVGDEGVPNFNLGPLATKPLDFIDIQFNRLLLDSLSNFVQSSKIQVILDGVILNSNQVENLKNRDLSELIEGKVLRLTPDGGGFSSVQEAIDSITDASATKRYVISLAPGVYSGSVVLKRYVYLTSHEKWGMSGATILTSSSGVTLTMPCFDCGCNGILVQTTSTTATDSAVRCVDDGGGVGTREVFLCNYVVESTAGARGIHVDNIVANANLLCIYGGVNTPGGGDAFYVDAGGCVIIAGGLDGGADIGIHLVNGGLALVMGGFGINAQLTSGWAVDANGGLFVPVDCLIDGKNGIRGANGTAVFGVKMLNLGGISGTPVDIDVTSFMILGSISINAFGGPGSAPFENWNVAGTLLRLWTGTWGSGTVQVTDQRPPNVPHGFEFYAYDTAPGGGAGNGVMLTYNAFVGGWVDTAGNVIP